MDRWHGITSNISIKIKAMEYVKTNKNDFLIGGERIYILHEMDNLLMDNFG